MKWTNYDQIILNYMRKLNSFKHIPYVKYDEVFVLFKNLDVYRQHEQQMNQLIVIHVVMMLPWIHLLILLNKYEHDLI